MEGICETPELRVGDTPWWECVTRQRSRLIQRRQYEDLESLLIVLREKWAFNVAINTHCKWSQLHYITKTLQQKGEYDLVKHTYFGMLLDVYPQGYFCVGLLHSIMIHRITERQSMDHELWFTIGKSKARLSKQEFCLITGLKFGSMPDVFRRLYEVAADGIHARYWNGEDSVKLQALLDTFRGGNFQRLGDESKMALVLIANNILFGQDYRRRMTPWLLSLVEDIDAWNVFPWGHYVWKLTLDYLLKGFEVLDLSVTKETRLRYNIYGFAWVIQFWAMEAISTLRKIVAPSGLKDNVHPRMCRWDCNQKPKDFYKTIQKLESFDQLSEGNEYVPIGHMEDRSAWGLGARQKKRNLKEKRAFSGTKRMRTIAALVDELMDEGDDHGRGSEQPTMGRQLQNHPPVLLRCRVERPVEVTTGPQAPISLAQPQTANEPTFTKTMTGPEAPISPAQLQTANELTLTQLRTVNDGAVTTRQLRRIMGKHEKDMLELKASIQSLSVAMQTIEDRIVGRILDGLKSQGGPSHDAGLEHDDADDGQHHEPGVDIDDDVLGADGEHVTHVDDVVKEAVAVDVTLQSNDVEGEHIPSTDAFIDAAAGAIVLYRESTPDAVKIRLSSPESSAVHHGAAEISDPTERAWLKMASKYMASPFVNPLVTGRDVRDKIVEDYEAFKKEESVRCNVGILGDQGADFFIILEDPNEEMTSEHINACLSLLYELRGYVEGESPTYAKKWEDVDFILTPCNVGGHWVVAKIDLVRWTIKVVDSAITSDAKDNGVRAGQMTPLTTMMPFICH
ncbi:Uncharacterized protein TCM_002293 [Theobroma cacao]|uniref:Ubiquitin-like protease family profile domain-containing protein n=1 Tax=Theobroma cacao TaxID=3641 RepID=A0A061DLV6_THECC|nr:Uncharacterized protein TCM_002293 [Theobroma cacao]